MATQEEIEKLAQSLKANGLAASDIDAVAMAERILGKAETPERRFEKSKTETEAQAEPEPVKIEDIKLIEKKEGYDITKDIRTVQELFEKGEDLEKEKNEEVSGFKEVPVEKKKKPTLTEEEKEMADLTKWFYFGKK